MVGRGSVALSRYVRILTLMENNVMQNQEAYQRAKKRVAAKFRFYIHLGVYIAVNSLLIIINLSTSTQSFWFKWPLIGWGIGVLFHALGVFVFSGRSDIKQQMIEKEMRREASDAETP